jgi:hypothetical protein
VTAQPERRRTPRVEILRRVHGRILPRNEAIFVRQISEGGMRIETRVALDPLEVHQFRLTLDARTWVDVRARIVHGAFRVLGTEVRYSLGLEFVFTARDSLDTVRAFIETWRTRRADEERAR